jgi:hypothetical protein
MCPDDNEYIFREIRRYRLKEPAFIFWLEPRSQAVDPRAKELKRRAEKIEELDYVERGQRKHSLECACCLRSGFEMMAPVGLFRLRAHDF